MGCLPALVNLASQSISAQAVCRQGAHASSSPCAASTAVELYSCPLLGQGTIRAGVSQMLACRGPAVHSAKSRKLHQDAHGAAVISQQD